MMPKVVSYHPSLVVAVGPNKVRIDCTMNDYYTDDEVMDRLRDAYGASTNSELVRSIKASPLPDRSDIMAVRVT